MRSENSIASLRSSPGVSQMRAQAPMRRLSSAVLAGLILGCRTDGSSGKSST
jgi:hypothetical protein